MLSNMEKLNPSSESTLNNKTENILDYSNSSFLLHRGGNINSTAEKNNSTFYNISTTDSGYHSSLQNYGNFTSGVSDVISLPTSSSTSIVDTTPQKSVPSNLQHGNNLSIISGQPDATVKLTPVTQNIRIFSNIHITTPKSQEQITSIENNGKRNALDELKFDDYQNTPKKKRIDDGGLESLPRNILNMTPLRSRRTSTIMRNRKKLLYRQKLRSAPDLDLNNSNDDNVENAEIDTDILYEAFTPIRNQILSCDKRTPLSSTNLNLIQASTPKSIGKFDENLTRSSSYFDKPASVRKLLSFSDKEFEALLSSSKESVSTIDIYQEDSFRDYKLKQPIISSYKSIMPPYVPETSPSQDKKSFKRTLKFAYQSSPEKSIRQNNSQTSIQSFSNENNCSEGKNDKDHMNLKRQRSSTTFRLIDIKENQLIRPSRNRKFQLKQQEKVPEKEFKLGFQDILGYIPSSYDLKISTKIETKEPKSDNKDYVKRKLPNMNNDIDISSNSIESLPNNISNIFSGDCCESRDFNEKLFESTQEKESCKLDNDLNISRGSSKSIGSVMSIDKTPDSQKNINIENNEISFPINDNIPDFPDQSWFSNIDFESGILTPPRYRSLSPSNNHGKILKTNFCEKDKFLPSTPRKKTKQHNNTCSSIDYERNEILYPTIPKTPKKPSSLSASQNKHKFYSVTSFSSTSSSSCSSSSVIPLKRKLSNFQDTEKRTKIFYDGFTHLNIIAKLEPYNLVLDRIFSMLSSQDLVNIMKSSKNLNRIVLNNQKSKLRISKYLIEQQKIKENDMESYNVGKLENSSMFCQKLSSQIFKQTQSISKTPSLSRSNNLIKRKTSSLAEECSNIRIPFKNCNSVYDRRRASVAVIQRSPPVSPSKRKFHENQKVVKLLSGEEKLIKCPRCSRSSRIINIFSSQLNSNKNDKSTTQNAFRSFASAIPSTNINNYYYNSNNNNNNDDDFILYPNSQPVSSSSSSLSKNLMPQLLPSSSLKVSMTKTKLIKSMSADSAFFLPTTPKKLKSSHHNRYRHRQTYSLDENPSDNDNNIKKYGECTGIACKYRFCLDCLCEYHPDTSCRIRSIINNSPSKDDVQNGVLEINAAIATSTIAATTTSSLSSSSSTRSLKTRRKSLKRLCF